jgi:hypothetical protein
MFKDQYGVTYDNQDIELLCLLHGNKKMRKHFGFKTSRKAAPLTGSTDVFNRSAGVVGHAAGATVGTVVNLPFSLVGGVFKGLARTL